MWRPSKRIPLPRNTQLEYNSGLITVAKCAVPKCKTYLAVIDNGVGRWSIDERIKNCHCKTVELACEEHREGATCSKPLKKQKTKGS